MLFLTFCGILNWCSTVDWSQGQVLFLVPRRVIWASCYRSEPGSDPGQTQVLLKSDRNIRLQTTHWSLQSVQPAGQAKRSGQGPHRARPPRHTQQQHDNFLTNQPLRVTYTGQTASLPQPWAPLSVKHLSTSSTGSSVWDLCYLRVSSQVSTRQPCLCNTRSCLKLHIMWSLTVNPLYFLLPQNQGCQVKQALVRLA